MKSQTVTGMKADAQLINKAVREDIKEGLVSAQEKMQAVRESVKGYAAQNPKTAAAIAVGTGVLAGAAATAFVMKKKPDSTVSKV
jgi:ElaB/YqjD/DUF883 family membrane-anchored ribosome-binding protein